MKCGSILIFNRVYIVILTPIGPFPALLVFLFFCLSASLSLLIIGQAPIYRAGGPVSSFPGLPPSSSSSTCSFGRFNLIGVGSVLVVDELAQQASPGVLCVIRNVNRRRCATQKFIHCLLSSSSLLASSCAARTGPPGQVVASRNAHRRRIIFVLPGVVTCVALWSNLLL